MLDDTLDENRMESVEGRLGSMVSRFLVEQEMLLVAQQKELKSWLKKEMKAAGYKRNKASSSSVSVKAPMRKRTKKDVEVKSKSTRPVIEVIPPGMGVNAVAARAHEFDPAIVPGYLLFSKERRAADNSTSKNKSKVTRGVATAWAKLTENQKLEYAERAQRATSALAVSDTLFATIPAPVTSLSVCDSNFTSSVAPFSK